MNNKALLAGLAVNMAFSGLTFAETSKKGMQIEEVVVTARKRDESLQEVPVAVTAVSTAEMAANNISTIADLAKIAPSLDQREGRKQGAFSIRGVGQTRINEVQADPGVAVYMDGVFLARNDSQLIDTLALESVQVLRGPQGTLFGKNSVGGAILVTTKNPSDEFAVNINTKIDDMGQRDFKVAFDIPLIEGKLFSKLTLGSVKSDGYAEDIDTGAGMGDDDRLLAALQVLWDINDDMSLRTIAYVNKQDENMPPHYCQQVTLEGSLSYARAPGRSENYNEACTEAEKLIGTGKVSTENYGGEFTSTDALFGATYTWNTPVGTLKSITSYVLKGDNYSDFDFDATDLLAIRNTTHVRDQLRRQGVFDEDGSRYTLGEELQFSGSALQDKLSYTVGLFGSWESLDKQLEGQASTKEGWIGFESLPGLPSANMICELAGIPALECLFVRGVHNSSITSYDNTSYAVFSQAAYDITPSLQLTAGLRYSYEQRKISTTKIDAATVPPIAGLPIPLPVTIMTAAQFDMLEGSEIPLSLGANRREEVDFERLSPMASLSWDMSESFSFDNVDALLGYVTASEGFKSGGFNVLQSGIGHYDPEYVISKEIGVKLDAFDRRLRFNTAIYRSDYKDIQVVVADIPALGAPEISTNNAGLALMQGIEFELTWLFSESFMIKASGNYIDAEFKEFDDKATDPITGSVVTVDRSSEPFPFIPKYVYNISARYSLLTTDFGEFDFVLSRNTRDDQFIGGDAMAGRAEFRDDATIKGFSTWSSRISWTPSDDSKLVISLYGNNLTDKEYIATGSAVYSGFGSNSITVGRERNIGLELSYEFN
ncbi:TonB-dependent receptor [Zhongshania aquimaris]|uniref:TonB-dependent receptor n=1 Tax=Zhongshania aquimaris TaxID=2857107 RepID=A0ABS6VSP6_9GAMM|nr:TonB-dependent receptor [Zhongshania aquimaris]MBW2941327.1 TonB-dependent receptor [Zhongshania aquimaris]